MGRSGRQAQYLGRNLTVVGRGAVFHVGPDVRAEGVDDLGDLVPLLLLVERGQDGQARLLLLLSGLGIRARFGRGGAWSKFVIPWLLMLQALIRPGRRGCLCRRLLMLLLLGNG